MHFLLTELRCHARVVVRAEQMVTHNGSADRARRFAKLLRRSRIRPIRARPYTPSL